MLLISLDPCSCRSQTNGPRAQLHACRRGTGPAKLQRKPANLPPVPSYLPGLRARPPHGRACHRLTVLLRIASAGQRRSSSEGQLAGGMLVFNNTRLSINTQEMKMQRSCPSLHHTFMSTHTCHRQFWNLPVHEPPVVHHVIGTFCIQRPGRDHAGRRSARPVVPMEASNVFFLSPRLG